MLNLGIKPIHYDFLNCFEDSIVSVAEWAGYRYELMFSEAWSFIFDLDNYQKNQSLGKPIKVIDYDIFANLKKYHGIQLERCGGISPKKVIEAIRCELENNKPLLISIDSFYCPWDWNYGKRHLTHAILIIGIGDNGEVFCCDGFFRESKTIALEKLEQGYLGWFLTFEFQGNEKIDINWCEILGDAIVQLKEGKLLNSFDSIRKYADALEDAVDIKKEVEWYEDNLFDAPLIKHLEQVTYGRRKFARLLNYFGDETGIQPLSELSNNLIEVASLWANVRTMLIKMAYLEDISLIKKTATKKIREIADFEENIASQILKICHNGSTSLTYLSNRYLPTSDKVENINTMDLKKVLMVDLSPYFNNKAFGESISLDCTANFTGVGEYLLKENIPGSDTWKIGEMEFRTLGFNGIKDNISCNGQKITIQGEAYSSIIILGSAEWGSFTDKLVIHFINDQAEEINIRFSEWIYKPMYGETIAWEGKAVERIKGEIQLKGAKVHLFIQQYHIRTNDKIDFLQLPDCPGMHIFAITLA